MDVVGSEIGQKMRSAIKAKLTELGCYVDDELPDYVMVMVANKRTRSQMEEDLQLFLGENTVLFVNWLHQVLKKLQQVTVSAAPIMAAEPDTQTKNISTPPKQAPAKEKKSKQKKEKSKDKHKHSKSDSKKKSKKKIKDKHKKKSVKKEHKSKKKYKNNQILRPNIPPLLMNLEKVSEPSITDIFAGQILKNHGVTIEEPKSLIDQTVEDKKPVLKDSDNPVVPIIDPNSIVTSATDDSQNSEDATTSQKVPDDGEKEVVQSQAAGEEELKQIETKIQGLRQKLAVQLETMSDDEDFLNIRTEADELMNDFAEDVCQEISSAKPASIKTPPLQSDEKSSPKSTLGLLPDTLPQIELNLPKRPARERLGIKEQEEPKRRERRKKTEKRRDSNERFTPENEPEFWPQSKSAKSRLGELSEMAISASVADDNDTEKLEHVSKKTNSRLSPVFRAGPASVVRVRPRPRPGPNAPASNLLLRAMADAHKSLFNLPPKQDPSEQKVKRALVLPMRRGEPQKIVIQVAAEKIPSAQAPSPVRTEEKEDSECELELETDSLADLESDDEKNKGTNDSEYVPSPITRKISNTNYVPSRRTDYTSTVDETIVVQTINNAAPTKEKGPTFVVTLDGLDPNIFLAKKLKKEGLLDDGEILTKQLRPKKQTTENMMKPNDKPIQKVKITFEKDKKRLSDTSEESDTQVILQSQEKAEKRKCEVIEEENESKKRKASPIVFDVVKEKAKERERTESASSDKSIVISTTASVSKFDSVPSLPTTVSRKPLPCRAFPICRFGGSCAFSHPTCKFSTACSRRDCIYSHPHIAQNKVAPVVASHVVPAVNFKSVTSTRVIPNLCKFYPHCVNINCHFYHPKPCRYGNTCANKAECNFYHPELAANKWKAVP